MQMVLTCQELRILMRTKYEKEVSVQKTVKKINYVLQTSITQQVRNLVNPASEQNKNEEQATRIAIAWELQGSATLNLSHTHAQMLFFSCSL